MDPRDYISLGRLIGEEFPRTSPSLEDASYRTGIGRLYYGTMHWMRARFSIEVPAARAGRYHLQVMEKLESFLDDELIADFHFLMRMRVAADYDLASRVGKKAFVDSLQAATRLLEVIEQGTWKAYDPGLDREYFDDMGNG